MFARITKVSGIIAAWLLIVCCASADDLSGALDLKQWKHLADNVEWGFDLRLRDEGTINAPGLQRQLPNNEINYIRIRPRIWLQLNPVDDWLLRARLIAEPRYYFQPAPNQGWANEEGLFDELFLRVTNLLALPITATLGRQEFSFGNKWLIWDGTGMDGSRSEYFDAARVTIKCETIDTTIDAIYILQDAHTKSWLPVWHEVNPVITEQDDQAAILYLKNCSLPQTQLEAYAIFRHEEAATARGNNGDMWLVGGRICSQLGDHWEYRGEFAPQFGRLNGADLRAWGANQLLTYRIQSEYDTRIRLGYEYLSGDNRDSSDKEGWEPMWARRAQWSELMVTMFGAESRGRAGDYKNLHRPSIGFSCHPTQRLDWTIDYAPLYAVENPSVGQVGYGNGKFRGHFCQSILKYKYHDNWSGLLWAEVFVPGNYYASQRRDPALFYRAEIDFRF